MMAQEHAIVDITNIPELRRIAEKARDSQEPIILRVKDEEIAKITPLEPARHAPTPERTAEDFEGFMSTFGAWKGVDVEQLKKDIRAARGSNRPVPKV